MVAALVLQGRMIVVLTLFVGQWTAGEKTAARGRVDRLGDTTLDLDHVPAQARVGDGTAEINARE